jgi:hypothetical protein
LRLLNRFERAGREECKDRGAQTCRIRFWNQDRLTEDTGINPIQRLVALWNAARVDQPLDRHTVLPQSFEHDPRVERRAFDGREKLIRRGVVQAPSESGSPQPRVAQYGPIAVIPGQPKQARLSGTILTDLNCQGRNVSIGPSRNRIEQISCGGEPGLNTDLVRVDGARHHA